MSPTAASESHAYTPEQAKRALIPLLFVFILNTLALQAFNFVFQRIGDDLGAADQASLITAIPLIVLGIVCFIYGSLGDFVSLRKVAVGGSVLLVVASVAGFLFHDSILAVIIARCLQVIGGQTAGSLFLVVTARYVEEGKRVIYYGIFTAAYELAVAIGIGASGFLSMVDWSLLFLIPALAVLALPALIKSLPDAQRTATHVDVPGFTLFGIAIGLLTLSLYYGFLCLAGSLALIVVFDVYILRAKDPFITPAFFKNPRWLKAIALVLIFYFINYSVSPVCSAIGSDVYGLTSRQTSLYLMASTVTGLITALASGKIAEKVGLVPTTLLSAALMIAGLVCAGLCVQSGMVALALSMCLFYGGIGMIFSPLAAMVIGTVDESEAGRGVGMNDLAMNVTASVGVAVFGSLMGGTELAGFSPIGAAGTAAVYSNLLFIYAAVVAVGVVALLLFRRSILR